VLQVIKLASEHLQKHNSDSARLDAEVLLAAALGLRRLDLYLQFDRPLTDGEAGLRVVRLLEAAQQSIKNGGQVQLLNSAAQSAPVA